MLHTNSWRQRHAVETTGVHTHSPPLTHIHTQIHTHTQTQSHIQTVYTPVAVDRLVSARLAYWLATQPSVLRALGAVSYADPTGESEGERHPTTAARKQSKTMVTQLATKRAV